MADWQISFSPLYGAEFGFGSSSALITDGLAIALIIAFGLFILGLAKQRWFFITRALGLLLFVLALANPTLNEDKRQPLKDTVLVVYDTSGSQTLGERAQQMATVRKSLPEALAKLPNIEPVFTTLDGLAAHEPDNDGTRVFAAISKALATITPSRLGAVVIVTDGEVHDVPQFDISHLDKEALAKRLSFDAPIHVLLTGHAAEEDRVLKLLQSPRFGFVGKAQSVQVTVEDWRGDTLIHQGRDITLTLKRDGVVVGTYPAQIGQIANLPVTIPHAGPNIIEVSVEPLVGELTTVNDHVSATVEGVREKLKVLLVSGEPTQDERMWRNILKSDVNVELVHFTILRPADKANDGTPISDLSLIAFPVADLFGNKIKDFDLIIFDRFAYSVAFTLDYFDNIVRFVKGGGALMITAGPEFATTDGLYFTPLGEILPVRPQGSMLTGAYVPHPSEVGLRHPVVRGLPGLLSEADASKLPNWAPWFSMVQGQLRQSQSEASVLFTGRDDAPLLVAAHVGKGRVATLLANQMWLWARGYQQGGPYSEVLRRLTHWLMQEPELEEERLSASARGHTIFVTRQSLAAPTSTDASLTTVTLTKPNGETQPITLAPSSPGQWTGQSDVAEFGLYQLSTGALKAFAVVGADNLIEFENVISTTKLLQPLAELTGGSVRRLDDGAGGISLPRLVSESGQARYAGADFIGIKQTDSSLVLESRSVALGTGLLGLLVLYGVLLVLWGVERG